MRLLRLATASLGTLLLILSFGCRPQAPRPHTDQQLMADVNGKIQAESTLAGQNIQIAVSDGVVTLSGSSTDAASRNLAGTDAGSVTGVRAVVNNLEVRPPATTAALPAALPAAPQPVPARRRHRQADDHPQPKSGTPLRVESAPPPAGAATRDVLAAPAPPLRPLRRTVTLAAGTVIPVRITESLDSENAEPNQTFHGTIAADLERDGLVVIPQGTPVLGRVVDTKSAARFKGSSLLALELTRIDLAHRKIAIATNTFSKEGAGRGKNTAEKMGGGAVVGAVIGAIAGGGKGAAIGAAAGAGAGAGANAATRGEQVNIPSEALLNFALQQPLSIMAAEAAEIHTLPDEPELSDRPQQ